MHGRSFLLPAALLLLSACQYVKYTATAPQLASRGKACEFQVITTLPAGGFEEIGILDIKPGVANTVPDLKNLAGPFVCEAGGDAVIALANGRGSYVKATVIKMSGDPVAKGAPPGAQAPGCQFDTQCKGDRVCVKGECVDPAKR